MMSFLLSEEKSKSKRERLLWICAVLLTVFTFLRLTKLGIEDGNDFPVFYAAAQRYLHSQNPYIGRGDPLRLEEARMPGAAPIEVVAYGNPPLTTATLATCCWADLRTAKALFTLLSLVIFFGGFWAALAVFLPEWSPTARMFFMIVLLQTVCIRWIVGQLQTTVIVMGALGLFLYADSRRSNAMMFWSGIIASLKPTLFLPVIALLLFRRQPRLLILLLLTVGLLNIAAAMPGGLRSTIAGYRLSLANFSAPGSNNFPDAHQSLATYQGKPLLKSQTVPGTSYPEANGYTGEQLSWKYLFSGWTTNLALAGNIALACTILSLSAFGILWRRSSSLRDDDQFMRHLFCLALSFSLLCIYHQRYDVAVLLYTLIFVIGEKPRLSTKLSATIAGLCLFAAVLYLNSMWMRLLLFAAPHDYTGLIPLRSYAITVLLILQFWQINCYVKSTRSHTS